MPRFDPAEFGRLLARLTPHELRQAEGMVAQARERAEAVLEIDARAEADGPAASCPRCGGDDRVRWGRTRTGAQRWRCSGCRATWSGRSGTPLARTHRPDLVAALARDMIEAPHPMSCRRGAEVLGASRHSIWRWRMVIIGALAPEPDGTLAGIVEADEAHQRESRKGSREWVRHRRDPANYPAPPRLRWRAYRRRGGLSSVPPGGWGAGGSGEEAPRGHGPCWPSGLRGYRGRGPGGDLRCPAARDGAGRGALHRRPRNLRADRQGRAYPALRAQRRAAVEAHAAQPSHQHRERPDRPVPHLHAALLRTRIEEPRRLWPVARCP